MARRGATAVLRALCVRLGTGLWLQLPMLWDLIALPLVTLLQQQQHLGGQQQQQQHLAGQQHHLGGQQQPQQTPQLAGQQQQQHPSTARQQHQGAVATPFCSGEGSAMAHSGGAAAHAQASVHALQVWL